MIGSNAGSYQITEVIAHGGMGTVYKGVHQLLGRQAAIKILLEQFSQNREVVNRFFNEAKATTSIRHPGIVEVFDFGYLPNGLAFIVMEFLDGEPLSYYMRRGRMTEPQMASLLRSACGALSVAHAQGIVHRDLKPDNIFVVRDNESPWGVRTKLLDFGIAKLSDLGMAGTATKTGSVLGTPTYMSPEQCKGVGNVDARADLYSMGCILYEMVTGRPPFKFDGTGELIGAHLFMQPDPPSMHGAVSPEVEQLILCLLQKDPAHRLQSADDLNNTLRMMSGETPTFAAPVMAAGPNAATMTPWSGNMTPQPYGLAPAPGPVPTPGPRAGTPYPVHMTPGPMMAVPNSGATPAYAPTSGAAPAYVTNSGVGAPPNRYTPQPMDAVQAPPLVTTPTTIGGSATQANPTVGGSKPPWTMIGIGFVAAVGAMGLYVGVLRKSDAPASNPKAGVIEPANEPANTTNGTQPSAPAPDAQPAIAATPDAAPPSVAPRAVTPDAAPAVVGTPDAAPSTGTTTPTGTGKTTTPTGTTATGPTGTTATGPTGTKDPGKTGTTSSTKTGTSSTTTKDPGKTGSGKKTNKRTNPTGGTLIETDI